MTFWADVAADLAELIRHPRAWWYRATHTPCPVCGQQIHVGGAWHDHKSGHDPAEWAEAIRPRA